MIASFTGAEMKLSDSFDDSKLIGESFAVSTSWTRSSLVLWFWRSLLKLYALVLTGPRPWPPCKRSQIPTIAGLDSKTSPANSAASKTLTTGAAASNSNGINTTTVAHPQSQPNPNRNSKNRRKRPNSRMTRTTPLRPGPRPPGAPQNSTAPGLRISEKLRDIGIWATIFCAHFRVTLWSSG